MKFEEPESCAIIVSRHELVSCRILEINLIILFEISVPAWYFELRSNLSSFLLDVGSFAVNVPKLQCYCLACFFFLLLLLRNCTRLLLGIPTGAINCIGQELDAKELVELVL